MSGLFRRLAQHASGRATTLHAPARLPFHNAPSGSEALESANATVSAQVPSPIVAMAPQPRSTPQYGTATPEPYENASGTPAAAPSASSIPPARGAASALYARDDDTPPNAPLQPAEPPARRARISTSALEVPAPIARQIAAEAPSRPSPATGRHAAGTTAHESAAEAIEKTTTPEFPPTLLPPHADAARAAPAAPNTRPQQTGRSNKRAQSVAADVPNEVHVHIGRIEVTAIQETAPKPRAKRNGRAPMSLDEYLAKRQRGSS